MENNEIMTTNEEMEVMDNVEETEARDHSGAIGFALGSLLTVGVIAGVKKGKKLIANIKAKRAAKEAEACSDEDSEQEE